MMRPLERVQMVGDWLRRRQRGVVALALAFALVLLAVAERSSLEYRSLLVSVVAALCVVSGIVSGPWVGLGVAVVAGALSAAFVFPFDDPWSVVAGLSSIVFWAAASLVAGLVSDHYRREVALRQAQVDERQRLGLALNEIGSAIVSGLDRDSLLPRIVRLAGEALGADGAAILDRDGARWRIAHGWALDAPGPRGELGVDEPELAQALETARSTIVLCANGEHGLRVRELEELGAQTALVAPLLREESVDSVLLVVARRRPRLWDPGEREFVQKVGTDLAAALENVRLYEAQRRIATTLQEQLIHELPGVDGLELAAVTQSAAQPELVGGDFYDVLELPDGSLSLLIGDVEGKGVRAAGMTERVRTMVRALWLDCTAPADVLTKAGRLLLREEEDQHVAAVLGRLSLPGGTLELAVAGHPPPVRCGSTSCGLVAVSPGPPLGAFDWEYEQVAGPLLDGETLVLCTDGVMEARRGRDLFGEARLVETVAAHRASPVSRLAAAVRDAALAHAGKLDDDLQILVARRTGGDWAGRDRERGQRTVR